MTTAELLITPPGDVALREIRVKSSDEKLEMDFDRRTARVFERLDQSPERWTTVTLDELRNL